MAGWHHQLNGYEFEQTSGYSEGRGSLVCCSPWGYKELDTTQLLNIKPILKHKAIYKESESRNCEKKFMSGELVANLLATQKINRNPE